MVRHVLKCKNERIVVALDNKVCDEIIHLSRQAFSRNCVYDGPLIHQSRIISEEEVLQVGGI